MKTRQTTVRAAQASVAAGTTIVPIRVKDPISRLLIPFSVTVGANVMTEHNSALFDRIAIIDGSDVLYSLTGLQTDGLARLDHIGTGVNFASPNVSIEKGGNLCINFGRYLYDKVLAFDPSRFDNPQIQLTRNWNTVEALCTADEFAIQAFVMEDLPTPPIGFLLKKEVKSWQAGATTWEYTEMPRDYVYRRIFLQAKTWNKSIATHWSRALLQEDNYHRVPFDVLVNDQIADNVREYGEIHEHASGGPTDNGDYFFCAPCYSGQLDCVNTTATNALQSIVIDGGCYNAVSANATDQFRACVNGYVPQGMVAFDLGPKDIIEDWYNPRELGDLMMEVYGGGAHVIRLVTEQLRPY